MMAAKTLAKRRALAPAIGPLLAEALQLMRERDTADGLHEEHAALRGDRIYSMILRMIESKCEWEGTSNGFDILNPEAEDEAAYPPIDVEEEN
jgi:hypothetical protein